MSARTRSDSARPPEASPPAGLTSLEGVGPVRAERLGRLGVRGIRDLLLLVPRRLEEIGPRVSVAEARGALGAEVSVVGRIASAHILRGGRRRSVVRARLEDGEAAIGALFFNQPWQREALTKLAEAETEVELYGSVVETKSGPALASPRIGTPENPLPPAGALVPHYPLTDGVGQAFLRGLVRSALELHGDGVEECLPAEELERADLPALPDAVRALHAPRSPDAWERARRRVALEPLLALQARLALRATGERTGRARTVELDAKDRAVLFAHLPFAPTDAQRRVTEEILADLGSRVPMRRLLQGDVGAGKTAVGFLAALAVARAGGQAALMAPTELLAEQHVFGLGPLLARAGLETTLLTGGLAPAARRRALASIASGRPGLVVGTHALFSDGVEFGRLDLAIVDEQQRFGVAQRRELLEKGEDVHMLLMTATPIPRTLALTLYGDLSTSVLDELPSGRGTIATHVLEPEKRDAVERRVAERVAAGERAFWVTPRIGASEEAEDDGEEGPEIPAAEEAFERLAPRVPGGVELVHGRLDPEEREARLERFRTGASRLLVGTTVVEVGVDVPEATLMVIDGAERFGLAQLHQLRGRIGRGPAGLGEPVCVLLARGRGRARCEMLASTRDGFVIAEEDLRLRGMGDLAGLRQAGESGEGLDDPAADLALLLFARRMIEERPDLRERYGRIAPGPPA